MILLENASSQILGLHLICGQNMILIYQQSSSLFIPFAYFSFYLLQEEKLPVISLEVFILKKNKGNITVCYTKPPYFL